MTGTNVTATAARGQLFAGRGTTVGAGILALAAIVAYFLLPDDLAFLTRIISTILFVLSLDLVVGYAGIATLGHSVLFGAGAYAAGIVAVHMYNEPAILLLVGGLAGALMGLVNGALIVRFSGLPQLVLSIAFVQLMHELANKASAWTGGSDGLSGIEPTKVLGVFGFDLGGRTAYISSVAVLLLTVIILRRIVRSPFGLLCQGIREDPIRVSAMGGNVFASLVAMYAISGAVAGLGGALAAVTAGVVGLDSVSFERSADALVMLVLGGAGSLYGAIIGTVVFQAFEHIVSAANPFHWLTLVGALLIAVVLVLPTGLQGLGKLVASLLTANGGAKP